MSRHDRVLAVIQALYDAAQDEGLWATALTRLADVTHSQAATFWVLHRTPGPRLPTFQYLNFDPAFIQEYLDTVAPLDPTVQYLVAHPETRLVHDGLVMSESEKERHPYYAWHARSSDTRFRLVAQMQPAPQIQAGVALHRTKRAGAYRRADIRGFATLYEHLERALAIAFRLGTLGTMQRCTADVLDANPNAVCILDDDGHVVYANRRARDLHDAGDGFALREGIQLAGRDDQARLQTLIAEVLSSEGGVSSPGGVMRAGRPSGSRPYVVFVTPVSPRPTQLSSARPAVCVMVIDSERRAPVPIPHLEQVFGLTTAEARLAACLAGGEDLRTSAATLGITYGTARVRLADIFQKTGTCRQSELIALVLAATGR